MGGCPRRGVIVKAMDCGIIVGEFVNTPLSYTFTVHPRILA